MPENTTLFLVIQLAGRIWDQVQNLGNTFGCKIICEELAKISVRYNLRVSILKKLNLKGLLKILTGTSPAVMSFGNDLCWGFEIGFELEYANWKFNLINDYF